MSISEVKIEGFRGLEIASKLKRVNIVVGENGSGKTSFLESIFMSALFQSDINDNDVHTSLLYVLNSRGDILSAFSSLSDSKVTLDNITTQFKKVDPYSLDVEINNEKVAEIRIKSGNLTTETLSGPLLLPVIKIVKRVEIKYSPIYISTFFDSSGNPERIYSIAKRKNKEKIKSDLEILQDEFGQFKLYYGKLPAYVMGRGLLKRELIRLSLMSSNILLIDEIENSLHPDLVMEVLKDIKDEKNTQVIFTTHVNEVIKMAGKVFDNEEVQVLYLSRGGYKTYEISEISEFEKPLSWLGYV
ncbi:AAA family ATPase [Acidianus ambivalens]|uniref:AAA family ATPase n=1 Tax=Acidianus ambivalens TaxID=2283 RepID=A0A650CTY0_ACIAM|nr:AAA family ATPase [Acidianus ambivalens]MQL56204.1 AAA family ATPase [Acidianus ambivalens]QGR21258.1 AAA family ATPase [Acidianus ambivalens]